MNGTQVASNAFALQILDITGALRIGGNSIWGEWFAGLIDEVRIYNRALTAAEVQGDMNTPVGGAAAAAGHDAALRVRDGAGGGALLRATTTVTATASDNVGVAGVQFQLDGANLGAEDTTRAVFGDAGTPPPATNGVAHADRGRARRRRQHRDLAPTVRRHRRQRHDGADGRADRAGRRGRPCRARR